MTGESRPTQFQPGEVLAGRYQIERILGAGGMGVVVSARHLELDSLVAIKFLLPEVLGNPEAVARFAREARAAVKIKSEHVARVTDVGTLPNGAPYMVMEHLEGADLSALVRSQASLPIADVIDFVLQACEAIAEAHSVGIVHRDLKPGNLFLSRRADGSQLVKVLDFGISKMTNASGSGPANMTGTSAMLGSPIYMSPEQLTSARDVDERTDIWALGIILYELLSARLPFQADTIPQLCITILQSSPTPLNQLRPDLPAGLEAVILRCIEKDRTHRFASVGELAIALSEFAPPGSRLSIERILRLTPVAGGSLSTGSGVRIGRGGSLPTATVLLSGDDTQQTWGQTASKPKRARRPSIWFLAGAGLLVLVAAAVFALPRLRKPVDSDTSMAAMSVATPPVPGSLPPAPPAVSAMPTTEPKVDTSLAVAPSAPATPERPAAPSNRPTVAPASPVVVRPPPKVVPKPGGSPISTSSSAKPPVAPPVLDSPKPKPSDWENDRN